MSLNALPTEILTQVFSLLSSFKDAESLSRVSRSLHAFRRRNEASIFLTLAPRCMRSYQDALELICAQAGFYPEKIETKTAGIEPYVLLYNKFMANAAFIDRAETLYNELTESVSVPPAGKKFKRFFHCHSTTDQPVKPQHPQTPVPSPSDQSFQFRSLYYTALLLETHPDGEVPRHIWGRLTLRRLWCLGALIEWVVADLTEEQQRHLEVDEKSWLKVLHALHPHMEKRRRRFGLGPINFSKLSLWQPSDRKWGSAEWQTFLEQLPDET